MLQFLGSIFDTLFLHPVFNLLVFFYKLYLSSGLPGAFGFSVITLTLLIRFLFHPFFKQSIEMSEKMQDLRPKLEKIQEKHKKDPQKLQKEQMKLYQESGVNPASGCLFAIIQLPIFLALFRTLSEFFTKGGTVEEIERINSVLYTPLLEINKIDAYFFGLNLGISPSQGGEWYYYAIPVVTGLLQFLQAQYSPFGQMGTQKKEEEPTKEDKAEESHKQSSKKKEKKKELAKKEKEEEKINPSQDFQKAMAMQMKYFFPVMIAWFSYTLPTGLALYWNIFSIFSIMQHRNLKKQKEQKGV